MLTMWKQLKNGRKYFLCFENTIFNGFFLWAVFFQNTSTAPLPHPTFFRPVYSTIRLSTIICDIFCHLLFCLFASNILLFLLTTWTNVRTILHPCLMREISLKFDKSIIRKFLCRNRRFKRYSTKPHSVIGGPLEMGWNDALVWRDNVVYFLACWVWNLEQFVVLLLPPPSTSL